MSMRKNKDLHIPYDAHENIRKKISYVFWVALITIGSVYLANFLYLSVMETCWTSVVVTNPLPVSKWGCGLIALCEFFLAGGIWMFCHPSPNRKTKRQDRREEVEHEIEKTTSWIKELMGTIIIGYDRDHFARYAATRLSTLGYGIVNFDARVFSPFITDLLEPKDMEEWKKQVEAQKSVATAIARIWNSALCGCVLAGGEYAPEEEILAMGRALGVPSMLEAYAAGVPIEDVVTR